jgi:hypothetical protein
VTGPKSPAPGVDQTTTTALIALIALMVNSVGINMTDGTVELIVTVVTVLLGAYATYRIPNKATST